MIVNKINLKRWLPVDKNLCDVAPIDKFEWLADDWG